jgi:hypothetical protein
MGFSSEYPLNRELDFIPFLIFLQVHFIDQSLVETAPAPTTENPRPRPAVKANTFTILEIEPM